MVAIHQRPEDHWMSLDVIGCWWLALSRKHGQGIYVKTVNKYSTNPLAKSPPKSTSSAITSQGAPLNKKNNSIPGINLHLVHGNPHPCNPSPFYQATSLPPRTVHKTCWAVTGQNMFTGKLRPTLLYNGYSSSLGIQICSIKYLCWHDL